MHAMTLKALTAAMIGSTIGTGVGIAASHRSSNSQIAQRQVLSSTTLLPSSMCPLRFTLSFRLKDGAWKQWTLSQDKCFDR